MSELDEQNSKVLFLTKDDKAESLWAISLGNNLYRLDNSPWWAYGVSWKDVVEAVPDEPDGLPVFRRVMEKSGNRTLRLVLNLPADQSPNSQGILDKLIELGCSYEGANKKYIAINVPPVIDLTLICNYLTETENQWEHADPTFEEMHPGGKTSAGGASGQS
jgi:hypothetical protein